MKDGSPRHFLDLTDFNGDDLRGLLTIEDLATFAQRLRDAETSTRVRAIGQESKVRDLVHALSGSSATVLADPVLANGRRELLTFLREQAISRTLHRFGHVAPDLAR